MPPDATSHIDWLSILSSWASIVGLVLSVPSLALTIFVFKDVKRIEDTYSRRANIARLLEELAFYRSNLNHCLNSNPVLFSKAEEELFALKPKLRTLIDIYGETKVISLKELNDLVGQINVTTTNAASPNVSSNNPNNWRQIYTKLIELEQDIKESKEMTSWKR